MTATRIRVLSRRGAGDARTERGRRPADRRDREPGRPKPRDHVLLFASRCGVRDADRRRRELVHVRDVGVAAGGADDPRRGPARAPRAQARGEPLGAASDRDALAPAAAPRPLPARDADRTPHARAPHAVRRVRARQRRRRARQPEGVRGDRAAVRALSPRLPARASSRPAGPGDPPEGQRLLRQAFARYERLRFERDPKRRAELALLANLEIGLHEQTRLQPEILEALDTASATEQDLGRRALEALFPSATRWWPFVRRPAAATIGVLARAIQRASSRLAREAITDSFMVLALPGRVLALGTHLADAYPDALAEPADPELNELLARFEPVAPDARRLRRARLVGPPPADALHRAPVPSVPPERATLPAALQAGSGGELQPRRHSGGRAVMWSRQDHAGS